MLGVFLLNLLKEVFNLIGTVNNEPKATKPEVHHFADSITNTGTVNNYNKSIVNNYIYSNKDNRVDKNFKE